MFTSKARTGVTKSLLISTAAVAILGHAGSASAYDTPPAWHPMTMATISLDANGALQMLDQNTFAPRCPSWSPVCFSSNPLPLATDVYDGANAGKPNLTVLSYADWDPAQPWAVLQNKAFSRQFGWWGGSGSAPATLKANVEATYGAGASIWIEMLAQSADLETYKAVGYYGVNVDNTTTVDPLIGAYAGLFGTAGGSTKWQWDYQMDHNTYAVASSAMSPGELFTATYKVYIGDSSGMELASAVGKSTTETWTWAAPVPEPETYALMLAGLGLVGLAARRRRAA